MNKKIIIIVISIVILAGAGIWFLFPNQKVPLVVTSYEECVAAGYPVLEKYPEQCRTPDGRTFTHQIIKVQPTSTVAFGGAHNLRIGEVVTFSDGLSLTLKEINDSQCKPNVQCIWQGEISALFSATMGSTSEEVRLGTLNNRSRIFTNHTLTLRNGDLDSVNITVAVLEKLGTLTGFIHIGPTCPVERVPPDPNCADHAYTDGQVLIRTKESPQIVGNLMPDSKGFFERVLPPGTYVVEIYSPNGSPLPRCDTKEAVITLGKTTNLDISCDSGIR